MTERGLRSGRRPRSLSRATELRAKLAVWREQPENGRKSVRAFASELGTSHQLLNFYLRGLDKWLQREYERKAYEIRALAESEHRSMAREELERMTAYQNAASRCHAAFMLDQLFVRPAEVNARRGQLSDMDRFAVEFLVQRGTPVGAKLLRALQKDKERKPNRLDSILRQLDQMTDSEEAVRLIRQLTPKEREEFRALQEKRKRARQRDRT